MKYILYKVGFTLVLSLALNVKFVHASSYIIYAEDDHIVCKEFFSQKKIYQDEDFSGVIQFTLEIINEKRGGTIHISSGNYLAYEPVTVGSNTTIKGDGVSTKIRFAFKAQKEGGIIVNRSDAVTISDLALSPKDNSEIESGIIVDNSGLCKLNNVYVTGFQKYGIWLRNRSFLSTISNCMVGGNKISNIYLDGLSKDGRIGNFVPNMVTNSMIIGGGKGIEARNSLVVNITGCMIHQTNDIAIHLHSISNAILISGCRTFQISNDAIVVEDTDELNVTSNIISWHEGNGIVVKNSAWGTITGNKFIDNGSYNTEAKNNTSPVDLLPEDFELKDGILLKNVTGYQVGGNSIYNWGVCPKMKYGIEEDSLCHKNIISNNSINYYELDAVKLLGTGSISENNLSNGEIPYTRIKKYSDKQVEREFNTLIIQSYQKELTEDFINQLK